MPLVSAILARNEAGPDRFLRQVIQNAQAHCDTVLLLDDGSTDDTVSVAKAMGCTIRHRKEKRAAWGAEAPARAQLWKEAHLLAGDGWVLFQDADQLLEGDIRPLLQSWDSNSIAIPLLDMWDADHYRVDGYWQGYRYPRIWLVRPSFAPPGWSPIWQARGMHCGHLPANWIPSCPIEAPDAYWRHLAYVTPEARQKKHAQYLAQAGQLSEHELAHVQSILDGAAV